MPINVYIVGRPGSGKSTTMRLMKRLAKERGYSIAHIKDYTILLDMREEPEHIAKFCSNKGEGFDILDPDVYDIALDRLIERIKGLEKSKYDIIFIEFARKTYEESFAKIGAELRSTDFILCVEANLKMCIERIYQRATGLYGPDHHFISEKVMNDDYYVDNLPLMDSCFAHRLGIPQSHLMKICNEGLLDELEDETVAFANIIFNSAALQRKTAILTKARKKVPLLRNHLRLSPIFKEPRVSAKTTSQSKRTFTPAKTSVPITKVLVNGQVSSSEVATTERELVSAN